MSFRNGYQYPPSNSFSDISITGLQNFCAKIAYLINGWIEANSSLEKGFTNNDELLAGIRMRENNARYYTDGAHAIDMGVSIATLRILNEGKISAHEFPDHIGTIPMNYYRSGVDTGERYIVR